MRVTHPQPFQADIVLARGGFVDGSLGIPHCRSFDSWRWPAAITSL